MGLIDCLGKSRQQKRMPGFVCASTTTADLRLDISARPNIGSLIIRIGFWGPLYHKHSKEPCQIVLVIII